MQRFLASRTDMHEEIAAWTTMDMQHGHETWTWSSGVQRMLTFSTDMQNGHAAWTGSMDIEHAAWRQGHVFCIDMKISSTNIYIQHRHGYQHGHGQAAQTWIRIMEMIIQQGRGTWTFGTDMDFRHGNGYGAWTWTCSIDMGIHY